MRVEVLIPWAGDDPDRRAALGWVTARYTEAGWPVIVGEGDPACWSKAAAVASALAVSDAELLVVADADVWCDHLDVAVDAVRAGGAWAMPHRHVHRLTRAATLDVYAGTTPTRDTPTGERPYEGFPGGGIVVMARATYEQVPLDRRFVGWGGEDESWAHALVTLAGKLWRGTAPLWHLWHPPQPRDSRRMGNAANDELRHRYRQARRNPQTMRALLDEIGASR